MKRGYLLVMVMVLSLPLLIAPTVPGAVYSDQQAIGANKPAPKVAEDLARAGIRDVRADHWAAGSISILLEAGLMKPDSGGNFNPGALVGAGDGIAIFAKVLGIASKTDTNAQAVAKMQEAGLVNQGVTADGPLSRLDVAHLLGQALGVEPKPALPSECPFADTTNMSTTDMGLLKALYDLGIFKGYVENGVRTFRPGDSLTRAEIAILVDRILGAH